MNLILAFLSSWIFTMASVPFAIWAAKKYGLIDDPSKRPHPAHIQSRVIPRAGGIPIYIGIFLTALIFTPVNKALIGMVIGSTFLLILGLIDDKKIHFSPYTRLFLLFCAAAAPVASGIGITYITNPFFSFLTLPQPFAAPVIWLDSIIIPIKLLTFDKIILIADILAFLWIATLTQVVNWSKGVDGQMPGITLMAALSIGLLSYRLFLQGDINQLNVAILSFIVAGSSLGFLIFNWYPSKILPGFSASTILALMLAVLSIMSGAKIATASLSLAIPIIDFFYTIIRRVAKGRSPVWGDRGHLHHRLLDLGWSHQKISLFYMLGSAILGAVAIFINTESKFFAILAITVSFLVFILWINSFGVYSKPSGRANG